MCCVFDITIVVTKVCQSVRRIPCLFGMQTAIAEWLD